MPDIQLTVHKTLVQANRCHVGKVEEQVKACEAKIQEITSRLSQNESAIQSAMADVRGVSEKVTAAVASAKQVVALTSQAEACNPRVLEICAAARKATASVRDKLITNAQERKRIEGEAARREQAEREQREEQERKAALEAAQEAAQEAAEAADVPSSLTRQPSGGAASDSVLPAGWLSVFDADRGASYFINKLTGKTQWAKPTQPAQTDDSLSRTGLQSVRIDGSDLVTLKATLSFVNDGTGVSTGHTARALHKLFSSICEVEVVEGTDGIDHGSSRSNSPFGSSSSFDRPNTPPLSSVQEEKNMPTPPTSSGAPLPAKPPAKKEGGSGGKEFVALRTTPQGPPEEVVVRVFKKGILLKQGKYFGSWRKLFFVLDGNCLEHYPSTQAYMSGVPATKKIILSGRGCLSYTKYSQCFSVSNGDRTTWTMMAENNEEFDEWMTGLRTVMGALFDDRISRVTTAKSPRASKR